MAKKAFSVLALGLLYLVSLLPFWLLYIIADGIFVILYYVVRYRRKVIDNNLENSFPEKTKTERDTIRKQYTRYLASMMVETIKLLTISQKEVTKRVKVPNPELITEAFAKGQSVIGILGHYGNWEMNALRFSQLYNERRIIVYKPLSNKLFNNIFLKMRSKFGATLVSMKDTMRKLVTYKNERTVTVLVGDQTPARPDVKYFTNFLNQQTAVFLGAEKLAKLTNSVVVFCDIRVIKRGYYQCTFVPLFANPKQTTGHEITNAHVQYLEQVIRQQPQYWLWSHRRWKFAPGDIVNAASL
ncbi:lysophospholipid acyltransferase family protein [Mucilaginibacter mali]|uniref:Lysophospholipid acyltransferase family protein n=1 Tax=Mucilaginibacter mali TaxID=2740462 RepID=A0A7D4UQ31_9SPHI|nr:lysophospholipid acyltransferase family protein [Mucilaginibacter mali]QKJ31860.1 lysophospholipid acyltransferase family protein [Mucilaginibacter mali]